MIIIHGTNEPSEVGIIPPPARKIERFSCSGRACTMPPSREVVRGGLGGCTSEAGPKQLIDPFLYAPKVKSWRSGFDSLLRKSALKTGRLETGRLLTAMLGILATVLSPDVTNG